MRAARSSVRRSTSGTVAGLTPAPSQRVAPLRVAESPAAFECRVHEIVDLGSDEVRSNGLVIARVVLFHVHDDALDPDLRPLADVLRLVGRMGRDDWVRTRDRFELLGRSSVDPDGWELASPGARVGPMTGSATVPAARAALRTGSVAWSAPRRRRARPATRLWSASRRSRARSTP